MPKPIRALLVFGTRPEAIKMAPIVQAMRKSERFAPIVAVTGQHREMLDQVLDLFGLVPDYDLNLMHPGQKLGELTARVLTGLEPVIVRERPDWVLVQGDTTTAFAGALAAFYAHVPVAHVEAGLRTRTIWLPFPEEANRRLITRLSSLHFAPTRRAVANLLEEGVPEETVHLTGNTVIDALFTVLNGVLGGGGAAEVAAALATPPPAGARRMILVTTHRRENWGEPMGRVYQAILDILEQVPDAWVLFPCHRNPVVRELARAVLEGHPRVRITDPLDYPSFVEALREATLVLSDSGGVQEEAPALNKPVLVLRDETERQEAIEAGTARLVGTDRKRIVQEAVRLLTDERAYAQMAGAGGKHNPFGDGHAAERILAALEAFTPGRPAG